MWNGVAGHRMSTIMFLGSLSKGSFEIHCLNFVQVVVLNFENHRLRAIKSSFDLFNPHFSLALQCVTEGVFLHIHGTNKGGEDTKVFPENWATLLPPPFKFAKHCSP